MLRILTDRGTEYCGRVEQHDYQLYLAINDIDHTKTKVMSPQTNGICERFHKTILQKFYSNLKKISLPNVFHNQMIIVDLCYTLSKVKSLNFELFDGGMSRHSD